MEMVVDDRAVAEKPTFKSESEIVVGKATFALTFVQHNNSEDDEDVGNAPIQSRCYLNSNYGCRQFLVGRP